MSGEYQEIGKSIVFSSALAINEINDQEIELIIKDIGSDNEKLLINALENLNQESISTSIILTDQRNYSLLNENQNIIFISLSNKSPEVKKNIINFGINLESQLKAIFSHFTNEKKTKTLVLYPEGVNEELFENNVKLFEKKIYKVLKYSQKQATLNNQIEKITSYNQRKINLNSRIKHLEALKDDINAEIELKKLEALDTLGNLDFDSIIILDFGEGLKSVLSTLAYVDAGSDKVTIATINQWFDESLFIEKTTNNILFPSINLSSFKNFNKNYISSFSQKPYEVSILSYDAIAYIYYAWQNKKQINSINNFQFNNKIKGRSSDFFIDNGRLLQDLNIYKVLESSFQKF